MGCARFCFLAELKEKVDTNLFRVKPENKSMCVHALASEVCVWAEMGREYFIRSKNYIFSMGSHCPSLSPEPYSGEEGGSKPAASLNERVDSLSSFGVCVAKSGDNINWFYNLFIHLCIHLFQQTVIANSVFSSVSKAWCTHFKMRILISASSKDQNMNDWHVATRLRPVWGAACDVVRQCPARARLYVWCDVRSDQCMSCFSLRSDKMDIL